MSVWWMSYNCNLHFSDFSKIDSDVEGSRMVEVRGREGNIYSGKCSNIPFCEISEIQMITINKMGNRKYTQFILTGGNTFIF